MLHRGANAITLAIVQLSLVLGCSGDDDDQGAVNFGVTVTGTLPGIEFSWDGDASALAVKACDEGCTGLTCGAGHLSPDRNCSSSSCKPAIMWSVNFGTEAAIHPPVTYGVVAGETDPDAEPLVAGVLHGVEVSRSEACPGDSECAKIVAEGCALFTP